MGDDEDGETIVSAAPLRPNPVTQDEMERRVHHTFLSTRRIHRHTTETSENAMHSILAVDDSASMRQMVTFTLKSAGYNVIGGGRTRPAWKKRAARTSISC